jgi:hypothetical protein
MREYHKIIRNTSTEAGKKFWASVDKVVKKADKIKYEPVYIYHIDQLTAVDGITREKITATHALIKKAKLKLDLLHQKLSQYIDLLRKNCEHKMCIEEHTYYDDEYGSSTHRGSDIRSCVDCHLFEEKRFRTSNANRESFDKLQNSKVIELHKTIDGKEYILEIKDLKSLF